MERLAVGSQIKWDCCEVAQRIHLVLIKTILTLELIYRPASIQYCSCFVHQTHIFWLCCQDLFSFPRNLYLLRYHFTHVLIYPPQKFYSYYSKFLKIFYVYKCVTCMSVYYTNPLEKQQLLSTVDSPVFLILCGLQHRTNSTLQHLRIHTPKTFWSLNPG